MIYSIYDPKLNANNNTKILLCEGSNLGVTNQRVATHSNWLEGGRRIFYLWTDMNKKCKSGQLTQANYQENVLLAT